MTGFIPKDKASRVKELLEGSFDCVIELADVTDEDEAPTVLKNNSFSSSAEGVLESYGLPKLRDIDPTKVMSYFYVFFFGMMLSDVAYGILMSIGCFIVLKKFPKMEEGAQAIWVLRTLNTILGRDVRRLFRRRTNSHSKDLLWQGVRNQATVVCTT